MRTVGAMSKKTDKQVAPTPSTPTPADLDALRNAQLRECADEVSKVLDKYGCRMVGVPCLAPNGQVWGLTARVDIASKV